MLSFEANGVERRAAHYIGPDGAVLAFKADEQIEFPSGTANKGDWVVYDFKERRIAANDWFCVNHVQRFPKAADTESPERYVPTGAPRPRTA